MTRAIDPWARHLRMAPRLHKIIVQSGRRIMAITSASQAEDVGSIPIARSTSSPVRMNACTPTSLDLLRTVPVHRRSTADQGARHSGSGARGYLTNVVDRPMIWAGKECSHVPTQYRVKQAFRNA